MGAFALWPWFCDKRLGNRPSWCRKRFSFDLCGSRWACGWHLAEVQWRTDRGQQEWDCQSAPGGRDLFWGWRVTFDCTVCLSSPTLRGAQGQRGRFCKNTGKWVPTVLYLANQGCTIIQGDFIFLVINTKGQIKRNLERSPVANLSSFQHMRMWLLGILSHFVWFCRNAKLIKPNQLIRSEEVPDVSSQWTHIKCSDVQCCFPIYNVLEDS